MQRWMRPCQAFVRSFSTARPAFSAETTTEPLAKKNGLHQFFENGEALPKRVWTGRAWRASELRQKSFDDLHKLWYVLLKERNLLSTQKEEARRLGILPVVWTNRGRMIKCQKSMARIKTVLLERHRQFASAQDVTTETTESQQSQQS